VTEVLRPSAWNVANALTGLRLALVPVFAALLLHRDGDAPAWRWAAAVAFGVAVVTDRVDGELARSRGLVTDVGKIADPIADKALVGAALISLSLLGELWWWVTAVILLREIGITLLRFVVIRHGVMPAGHGGKIKTAVQSAAILLFVAPLPRSAWPVENAVMGLAVFLTVATGADYVLQAVRLRRGSERTRLKQAGGSAPDGPERAGAER
jgi:CDP-diacylglycerol--glycerol-3-phosphate 3-phosphatidyltransferase